MANSPKRGEIWIYTSARAKQGRPVWISSASAERNYAVVYDVENEQPVGLPFGVRLHKLSK
jgi:hypothetical protein